MTANATVAGSVDGPRCAWARPLPSVWVCACPGGSDAAVDVGASVVWLERVDRGAVVFAAAGGVLLVVGAAVVTACGGVIKAGAGVVVGGGGGGGGANVVVVADEEGGTVDVAEVVLAAVVLLLLLLLDLVFLSSSSPLSSSSTLTSFFLSSSRGRTRRRRCTRSFSPGTSLAVASDAPLGLRRCAAGLARRLPALPASEESLMVREEPGGWRIRLKKIGSGPASSC